MPEATPIRIFIGSEPMQLRAEKVLEYSIRANTRTAVDITMMRNGLPGFDYWHQPKNPTGFTLFRFAIPHLCDFRGHAIYMDCDQLVLGDVAELASYFVPGKWVQHPHREGDAVSVIDCAAVGHQVPNWPTIDELKSGKLRKWDVRGRLEPIISRSLPSDWNSMDRLTPSTRLVHYTDLTTQPWKPEADRSYLPHPDQQAEKLWYDYENAVREFEESGLDERGRLRVPDRDGGVK